MMETHCGLCSMLHRLRPIRQSQTAARTQRADLLASVCSAASLIRFPCVCRVCSYPQGPQHNVNTTLNTFVCTQCAGIHRKFNHKVKTINMSTFTQAEVDAITAGGNKKARKLWLASFEEGKSYALDPEDPANVDRFMTMIYVEKRWARRPGDPDDDDAKKKDKKKDKGEKKDEKSVTKRKESVNDRAFEEATFPSSIAVTTVPAAAAPAAQKPAASANDLGIDFLSAITESTPAAQPSNGSSSNGFDSFDAPAPQRAAPLFDSNPQSNMPLFGESITKVAAPALSSSSSSSAPPTSVVQQLLVGMRAIQAQHDLTITQLTMAVQAALTHLAPAAQAAAASAAAPAASLVSPASSVASSKPDRSNLSDAFEGLSVPDDGEADTGNPFDSSDDDDDQQTPSSNQHYSRQSTRRAPTLNAHRRSTVSHRPVARCVCLQNPQSPLLSTTASSNRSCSISSNCSISSSRWPSSSSSSSARRARRSNSSSRPSSSHTSSRCSRTSNSS